MNLFHYIKWFEQKKRMKKKTNNDKALIRIDYCEKKVFNCHLGCIISVLLAVISISFDWFVCLAQIAACGHLYWVCASDFGPKYMRHDSFDSPVPKRLRLRLLFKSVENLIWKACFWKTNLINLYRRCKKIRRVHIINVCLCRSLSPSLSMCMCVSNGLTKPQINTTMKWVIHKWLHTIRCDVALTSAKHRSHRECEAEMIYGHLF